MKGLCKHVYHHLLLCCLSSGFKPEFPDDIGNLAVSSGKWLQFPDNLSAISQRSLISATKPLPLKDTSTTYHTPKDYSH